MKNNKTMKKLKVKLEIYFRRKLIKDLKKVVEKVWKFFKKVGRKLENVSDKLSVAWPFGNNERAE